MGFSMDRTSSPNANLKASARVRMFVESAGLVHVPGFAQYLESLDVPDLAFLSDGEWEEILSGMDPDPELMRRVALAIRELRIKGVKEHQDQAELDQLRHMINGGEHPGRHEAREAAANFQPNPGTTATQDFIPVAFFQGERDGFLFQHGAQGLGYYKEWLPGNNSTGLHPSGGPVAGGVPGSIATGPPPSRRPMGFDPISQNTSEQQEMARQRLYAAENEQALLLERRQRQQMQMQMQMRYEQVKTQSGRPQGRQARQFPAGEGLPPREAANARTRSSPFATT